jgi:mono/diheme cytochrome c family protein
MTRKPNHRRKGEKNRHFLNKLSIYINAAMKQLSIITGIGFLLAVAQSCSDVKREQNRVYMPDMAYSRAVETYSDYSHLKDSGIHYNATPVAGTVKRNVGVYYQLLKDTTGAYNVSAAMVNPLPALNEEDMKEAERLYLVNCGICHGQQLDGNGPLYKGGEGPYPAAPKNLVGDELKKMADGTMFHSITYGKNLMGGYASQVSPKQRWMIIHYIRMKQGAGKTDASTTADTTVKAAAPMAAPVTK